MRQWEFEFEMDWHVTASDVPIVLFDPLKSVDSSSFAEKYRRSRNVWRRRVIMESFKNNEMGVDSSKNEGISLVLLLMTIINYLHCYLVDSSSFIRFCIFFVLLLSLLVFRKLMCRHSWKKYPRARKWRQNKEN